MTDKIHEVIIIGSGPAGWSAAIYAARGALSPLLFAGDSPGGQLMTTNDVENYPGFAAIDGPGLMTNLENHAKKFLNEGDIKQTHVNEVKIDHDKDNKQYFKLIDTKGDEYAAYSIIIATGATANWLGLPSEEEYKGFGVSGCATCDGFFYKGKVVAIVGGGNAAVEEAIFLTNFATKVYLIHRHDKLRAEKILQQRLFANKKIEPMWYYEVKEVLGKNVDGHKSVTGIRIENLKTGAHKEIELEGFFVAIGHTPNSAIFHDINVSVDENKYIKTTPGTTKTNVPGVFACGDVQDDKYRQAITSAGSGCMAAIDAQDYLSSMHGR